MELVKVEPKDGHDNDTHANRLLSGEITRHTTTSPEIMSPSPSDDVMLNATHFKSETPSQTVSPGTTRSPILRPEERVDNSSSSISQLESFVASLNQRQTVAIGARESVTVPWATGLRMPALTEQTTTGRVGAVNKPPSRDPTIASNHALPVTSNRTSGEEPLDLSVKKSSSETSASNNSYIHVAAPSANSLACLERDFGENSSILSRIGSLRQMRHVQCGGGGRLLDFAALAQQQQVVGHNDSTLQHFNGGELRHQPHYAYYSGGDKMQSQAAAAAAPLHREQFAEYQLSLPAAARQRVMTSLSPYQLQIGMSDSRQDVDCKTSSIRCLDCNSLFKSLPQLTLHMIHFGHYANIISNSVGMTQDRHRDDTGKPRPRWRDAEPEIDSGEVSPARSVEDESVTSTGLLSGSGSTASEKCSSPGSAQSPRRLDDPDAKLMSQFLLLHPFLAARTLFANYMDHYNTSNDVIHDISAAKYATGQRRDAITSSRPYFESSRARSKLDYSPSPVKTMSSLFRENNKMATSLLTDNRSKPSSHKRLLSSIDSQQQQQQPAVKHKRRHIDIERSIDDRTPPPQTSSDKTPDVSQPSDNDVITSKARCLSAESRTTINTTGTSAGYVKRTSTASTRNCSQTPVESTTGNRPNSRCTNAVAADNEYTSRFGKYCQLAREMSGRPC